MNTIAELNDCFRKGNMSLGQYNLTPGVQALALEKRQELIQLVRDFDCFTPSNDPYLERDFGFRYAGGARLLFQDRLLRPYPNLSLQRPCKS